VTDCIWHPSPDRLERANLTRLYRRLGADGYQELQRISVEQPDRFWHAVVEDLELGLRWDEVVDLSRGPAWARWFVGATTNVARVCVH
jgi:acetyl-CoA synthetase